MTDDPGREQNGHDMLALARAHYDGDITIRQIAYISGLSSREAYDRLAEMNETHNLGDGDDPSLVTFMLDDDGKEPYPDDIREGWPDNDEEVPYDEGSDAWKEPYPDSNDD